ncbi:transcriptional regulator [Snodgrassella sp. ESL0324]|uniref:helix-turn-helix domain-containing protein n=1 Tax=Snodgrassella sp. ESL0324 TaxID=2705033 RepID=UPI00351B2EA5
MSTLSRAAGLKSNTLKTALEMPYLKGEKIIANIIGVSPEQIWPTQDTHGATSNRF